MQKKKATYLCQKTAPATDRRTFIPMYEKDDKGSVDKKHKLSHKFFEINYKGETIFVRTSTIVWLLQEGERVSIDRLIRVKVKQPYSSSDKQLSSKNLNEISKLSQKRDDVELGDLCVFVEETNGWMIGKIMQFARYKEKLKGNRQYKPTSAPVTSDSVGVLCSWFCKHDNNVFSISSISTVDYTPLTQYVCNLSLGCFLSSKHASNTESLLNQVTPATALYTAIVSLLYQKKWLKQLICTWEKE